MIQPHNVVITAVASYFENLIDGCIRAVLARARVLVQKCSEIGLIDAGASPGFCLPLGRR